MNPFKFGTIVEGPFFTDRVEKLAEIKTVMSSANHLVLISPRRFGKSSIVAKAVGELGRPSISVNLQSVSSSLDFAQRLIREVGKIKPFEKFKRSLASLRVVPSIEINPMSGSIDVSFSAKSDPTIILEDAFELIEKTSSPKKRTIVVLDEFQEIIDIENGLDKKLRAILQTMQNVNFVFLGSQESMMMEIFESKKSPFYHFGERIHLPKLPHDEFKSYIEAGLQSVCPEDTAGYAEEILAFTGCHPYYGQQLSFHVWETLKRGESTENLIPSTCNKIVESRDLDFTRLWDTLSRTDRVTIILLAQGKNPLMEGTMPTSTAFSAMKRLCKKGFLNKIGTSYEIEDPFFETWVKDKMV